MMKAYLFLLVMCCLLHGTWRATALAAEPEEPAPRRHLIICLDGVGFSLVEELRAGGKFQLFADPARMIAPFPTLTNVSMTEIMGPLGAAEAPGYEDSYYDTGRHQLRGGLIDRFRGNRFIKNTFREFFDYHPSAIKSGLGYAAPPVSTYLEAMSDLVRLSQKFRSSREPTFYAYLGATDSLAHLGGKRMLSGYLAQLDRTLTRIRREHGGRVEITLFSDHGNHFTKYRRVHLKEPLRRGGFRIEDRLRSERSVVIPQYGLIGCAVLFSAAGNKARLAELVAPLSGVSFAAYEEGGKVLVLGRGGRAIIERRGDRFRYRAAPGDPLGVEPIRLALHARGRADADDFIADADWLAALAAHSWPDAVRRVYEGLTEHIRNRASVVVNFEDGYYSGSAFLDKFAFLQATHGNLGREQSSGFVMSTRNTPGRVLRASHLWAAIGSPRLARSPAPGEAR